MATLASSPEATRPAASPAALALPAADELCRRLAREHYENFSVVSRLLPAPARLHLARLYAYCRTTDDLGDESEGDATAALLDWRDQVLAVLSGSGPARHPVLLALSETVRARALPLRPFLDLVEANLRDQRVSQYATWPELLAYSRLSAAPVGRLVLGVFGSLSAQTVRLSDDVCIGLQLANFAQDVACDAGLGRCYLLTDELRAHGLQGAVRRHCDRAEEMLASGVELERIVGGRPALQLSLYRQGGLAVVAAIRDAGYRTDRVRPVVSPARKLQLVAAAVPRALGTRPRPADAADRRCARIARAQAANFYLGFLALAPPERSAVYSLYAFARQVDAAADEAGSLPAATAAVAAQRHRLRRTLAGAPDDEVSTALLRTVRRYAIPEAELEALLEGVERDLCVHRYERWEDLAAYCSLVAAAVGRMCVRVFGFTDSAALERADELGTALQLTNILRDVREDAALGRVYLPAADLRRFGLDPEAVAAGQAGAGWEALVHFEAQRARELFASGLGVTAHIPRRAAACVRTMAGIYFALLEAIDRQPRTVLERRLSLPTSRKLAILARAWR
ncbi:MAG TPA: squalene/phytoene synthase family protein [Candidatus Dormibacteraeota bacterium]